MMLSKDELVEKILDIFYFMIKQGRKWQWWWLWAVPRTGRFNLYQRQDIEFEKFKKKRNIILLWLRLYQEALEKNLMEGIEKYFCGTNKYEGQQYIDLRVIIWFLIIMIVVQIIS
jgi:hypothetical protein